MVRIHIAGRSSFLVNLTGYFRHFEQMASAVVFLEKTADRLEANLGQRVPEPIWDALQLGAKLNKSPSVPEMKYTWWLFLLYWKQDFLSLQQLSHKQTYLHLHIHGYRCPHRNINSHDKQTLLKHCFPFNPSVSFLRRCSMHSRAECCVTVFKANSALPHLPGGGKNFKAWQEKWKGTLFIKPWRETYRGSASALNQPRLLDMLNRRAAEQDRLERGREGQRWRQKQKKILWNWRGTTQRYTTDKSNLALPHLCKSHLIFPLTYF